MIEYHQIRDVHLEAATLCNASCAWCPRTFWGYPYNDGYPELYLGLAQAKAIFSPEFLQQLKSIRVNGNFGDIVMNPDGADIIEYFRSSNPKIKITVHTNGGARDKDFWQRLAKAQAQVVFALDGLQDTHHLYRQNTVWSTVIRNADVFIKAGGVAVWQMIKFKHNLHQVKQCKQLSRNLGFKKFSLVNDGRDTAPVFDRNQNLVHVLGDYQGETSFPVLFHKKLNDTVLLEDVVKDRKPRRRVRCDAKRNRSIYIAANGDVSPCCWTGLYPRTFGHGQYYQAVNQQLTALVAKNNALEYSLQQCIEWFNQIQESWKISNYNQGRLVICDDYCGSNF
jgi:MoaA/NifB/PqqE/SkfB family radical SAM enzyme